MQWKEVRTRTPVYLNLGGNGNCHPAIGYENYIAIDINPPSLEWAVMHDLRDLIPLDDGTVDRILSEDFFEHISEEDIKRLLRESYRILRPGGFMRIAVPDYNNPKDRPYLKLGKDERHPLHVTLTNYNLVKMLISSSPFSHHKFYHYWDGDNFICENIDYTLGLIKRTPDNDPRCNRVGFLHNVKGVIKDCRFMLSKKFKFSMPELLSREGHRLYVTSLVVDLFKYKD